MLHKAQTRGLQVRTWIPSTARLPAKVGNAIAGRVSTPLTGEDYFTTPLASKPSPASGIVAQEVSLAGAQNLFHAVTS